MTHGKYLGAICKMCHDNLIHVTIESCGYGNFSEFAHALDYIDCAFIDIKIFDNKQHKVIIGMDNILTLDSVKSYELLPYHNLGEAKYKSLGRECKLRGTEIPSDETIRNLVKKLIRFSRVVARSVFW